MVVVKKRGWTWWQSEQEREKIAETEIADFQVYFI